MPASSSAFSRALDTDSWKAVLSWDWKPISPYSRSLYRHLSPAHHPSNPATSKPMTTKYQVAPRAVAVISIHLDAYVDENYLEGDSHEPEGPASKDHVCPGRCIVAPFHEEVPPEWGNAD